MRYGWYNSTWLTVKCIEDGCIAVLPWNQKYMWSIYYAFTTMTTVGYGDIGP
jgi:hypothetical protein